MLSFDVDASAEGEATRVTVAASNGESCTYRIAGGEHADYLLFFDELAGDFGTRAPGLGGDTDDRGRRVSIGAR